MDENRTKPSKTYWIISAIALLWNLSGVAQYLRQAYMSEEDKAALPEAHRLLMEQTPAWVTGAFAIAVFFGAVGSLLLLLRKRSAVPFLGLSLLAIIAQMVYSHGIARSYEVFGVPSLVFGIVLIGIGVFLYVFARKNRDSGILN